MAENNTSANFLFKLLKAIKSAIALFFGVPFTLTAVYMFRQTMMLIYKFSLSTVFPLAFLMQNGCLSIVCLCLAFLFIRMAFPEKLKNIAYFSIGKGLLVAVAARVAFTAINSEQTLGFRYANYPGYIEQWGSDVLYKTVDCDYSDGRILYFSGYFDFIDGGFRESRTVEIKEDSSLKNAYRIEVHYKGDPAELDIYSDTYRNEENISVWNIDYDYSLSADDYVYMYENKVNLEYCQRLAIEKITIYTAYPQQIDISGIEY